MGKNPKDFQRKVENRMFAIECSGRETRKDTITHGDEEVSEESRIWSALDENLSDADACKFFDGYLPLYSHRAFWGPFITFWKKVLRKLLKIFLGWYLFPIYQRQSHFNGKIINAVSSERDLLAGLHEKADDLNRMIGELERRNQELIQELERTVTAQREQERLLLDEIRRLRDRTEVELKTAVEELSGQDKRLAQDTGDLRERLENTNETITAFQRAVSDASDSMNLRLECLDEASTSIKEKLRKIANLPTDDDEFYHCFEERFRGAREDIRDRLRVYVPVLCRHLPDWSGATFVDVGSGRGEWLDILKENGATDYVGVDLNQRQNEICEGFGHKTICGDCIEYLSALPEGSVDLISGFQIIEHLCMSDLMELLKQSYRALKTGGMILFETPNPHNLTVAANTFFTDPSHKRVIDPILMKFLTEWCGYRQVQILDANSHEKWAGITEESVVEKNTEIVKAVNELYWLFYGPQDYALFAVKE